MASTPSSYIPTNGSTVTRAAETLTLPAAQLPWPTSEVIGEELVTNGDGTDTTDWLIVNDGGASSLVSTGNQFVFTSDATVAYAYIPIPTEVGKIYTLSFEVVDHSANGYWRLGNSLGNSSYFAVNNSSATGVFSRLFVATSTSAFMHFGATAGNDITFDNISVKEINPLAVSIQMDGRQTGDTYTLSRWYADANNYIALEANTSDFTFEQADGGTVDSVTGGSFTSDINVPYNIASRHGSTFINGAVDGVAITEDTTPTALPDLSTTDLNLAYDYMGTIRTFRVWDVDLGDEGLESASS